MRTTCSWAASFWFFSWRGGCRCHFKVASQILLIVQFLNIYGLYGEYPRRIARLLRDVYAVKQTPLVYSLISVACINKLVILQSIWSHRERMSA